MIPSLEGYSAAVLEDAAAQGQSAAVAGDIAAVDRLVRVTPTLHAAMMDTSIAGRARRAVLDDLLATRVAPAARRLAGFAAAAVPGPQVPGAIDWLVRRTHEAAEGTPMHLAPLSHLASRERAGGYATAVFEEASTSDLEAIEDTLFRLSRIVETTPELRRVLTERDLPAAARRAVVDDLLAAKVDGASLRLVRFVVAAGRPRDLVGTMNWLVEQAAAARGWRVARVRAAAGIEEADGQRLAAAMSRLTGTPVGLQVSIDPTLLAGVVVRIGDLQVDASARDRLERLREHMATGAWQPQLSGGRAGTGAQVHDDTTPPEGAH